MEDFRVSTVVAVSATPVLLFGGNAGRLALTINCSDIAANSYIRISTLPSVLYHFYVLTNPGSVILPYRDFGSLIRQPIYVSGFNITAGTTVNGMEVFRVPIVGK